MSAITLDVNWAGRPRSVAAALLSSDGHHALIDPGPESTLPTLREQLSARGLTIRDLDTLLLTHIHLDHAGATGAMVRENPRLAVYVHVNGIAHMIDPSRLLSSAGRLWGDDLKRLFGETLPVPAENLRRLEGGETLSVGEQRLEVIYTPGHASHHVSYFDSQEGLMFVGDTAGIRIEGGPYILPATPPPDISLELWEDSFAAILARKPQHLFLTHYGVSGDPDAHIAEFRERLHQWAALAAEAIGSAPSEAVASDAFVATARNEMAHYLGNEEADHYAFTAGLHLSFLGIARYLRKRTT
jgi:glyoxylase-like metal-dependent hydrolase (beta-lactamase superfamily II)